MTEENKCQTELILKKIDKIKAFKEKVIRIKEEEFKTSSASKGKNNNINILKFLNNKSLRKIQNNKNNTLKLLTKDNLSLSSENCKVEEKRKSTRYPELKNNEESKIILRSKNEIKDINLLGTIALSTKNIKTNRTVQLKPIKKSQITSFLSPIKEHKKNEEIIIIENHEEKIIEKEKIAKEKGKEKSNEKEKHNEKSNEKNKEKEKEQSTEREKEKVISEKKNKPKNISLFLKNNIKIKKEESKNEEEQKTNIINNNNSNKKNNISLNNINNSNNDNNNNNDSNKKTTINIMDIINMQKKRSSYSISPEQSHTKTTKNNNKSNNETKKHIPKKKEYKLQYCVYPGNNYKLIDKVMEHRGKDWEKVPTTYSDFCDLVWAPLTNTINFQNCEAKHQYVNHLEFNIEISNKMRLYANLLRHCEAKKIDIFSIFPFTISLQISHRSFYDQLDNFQKLYKTINNYTPKGNKKFADMFNVILSKKIGSTQTINIPETFNSGKNLWIIKPVNLNRGRFITVENNLSEILKKVENIQSKKKIYVNEKKKGNDIKCEYLILQKYLEKPLLYQGRKFDIRLWVLFIYDQEDDIFIFKQGHLKATCNQYNPDSKDLYVHLTNYSVQKHNENFSKIEIGNEIPFESFQNELDKNNSGINFYKDIYPKITRIVRITGGAAKGRLNFLNKKYCFEIFGYDFILDENYQPYLLEINTNPGLEISSPLIDELLPRMVDDALKLTIDKEFTKSYKYAEQESIFPVKGYDNKVNMWEKFSII